MAFRNLLFFNEISMKRLKIPTQFVEDYQKEFFFKIDFDTLGKSYRIS